jgi:hypothetical protein
LETLEGCAEDGVHSLKTFILICARRFAGQEWLSEVLLVAPHEQSLVVALIWCTLSRVRLSAGGFIPPGVFTAATGRKHRPSVAAYQRCWCVLSAGHSETGMFAERANKPFSSIILWITASALQLAAYMVYAIPSQQNIVLRHDQRNHGPVPRR